MLRVILAFAVLFGLSLAVAGAQDLAEIRARQCAALEKLTGEVKDAIVKSQKDPSNAAFTLKFMLRRVEDAQDISADDRRSPHEAAADPHPPGR